MASQTRVKKTARKQEEVVEDIPETQSSDLSETDELMAEIDNILDSNLVAKDYVQKGGE